MSSFLRELQQVYGEGYNGDITNFPHMASGQKAVTRSSISYYGLPGSQPGQGNPSAPMVTIPDEAAEDETISKSILNSKITELMQYAEAENMKFAKDMLFDLLLFIKKN